MTEAREFAAATGYPLIVKPRDAAGAAGTYRVENDAGLEAALRASGVDHGGSVAIEEFVEGHEGFYDTLSIDGVDEARARFGEWVIDSELPAPGTPTQPVEAGFMANGWVRVKHPDYDELRRMLDAIGELIRIHAS